MDPITLSKFIAGFFVLILGAELLVRGASRLAVTAGISSLVVGLTVVAYGTSAPELAVSIQSAFADPPQPDIAIGNAVGSNISNVLLVLGIAATCAPLAVSRKMVRTGVPLMILVSVLLYIIGWDGSINRMEGGLLLLGSFVYTFVTVMQSRREQAAARQATPEMETGASRSWRRTLLQLGLVVGGLALLVLGANWLVDGAVQVAENLGISKLIVSLTVVAVGTSLPEIAASVVAVFRGERDIAVGNVVGSNIFNILLVLGGCALVAPTGLTVSPAAMRFDIPVMIVAALACLPVFFTDYAIARWEGLVFLGYYAAYVAFLCLQATEHAALGAFNIVMLVFVVPLTLITFAIFTHRMWKRVKYGR